jgi:hypothetical protein
MFLEVKPVFASEVGEQGQPRASTTRRRHSLTARQWHEESSHAKSLAEFFELVRSVLAAP